MRQQTDGVAEPNAHFQHENPRENRRKVYNTATYTSSAQRRLVLTFRTLLWCVRTLRLPPLALHRQWMIVSTETQGSHGLVLD